MRKGFLVLACCVLCTVVLPGAAPAANCDFEPVRKQIDLILDQDKEKGDRFRREVAAGSDSLAVLERLVSEEMREKIDVCRFFAAEYLAKRGYPPAH